MPRVRVGRAQLYYERFGGGEPLLFVTGFAISGAVFDPVLDLYGERFACVTYDNRGAGRSSSPLLPTSMAEMAADAARLIERLGMESAHVYGLSMGGMIAQELALRFPERVRSLVLGCTTPGGPMAIRPTLGELGALGGGMARALREDGRPWLSAALFSPAFRREHPERVRELLIGFQSHLPSPHGAWWHLLASVYHDTLSRLHEIEAPTLVMHGDCDAMAPLANARLMAARIPNGELCVVPGAGHAYTLECPEESLRLYTEWLDRVGPVRAGRPREGLVARAEPLTRALGLPIGALRTGRSLPGYAARRLGLRRESNGSRPALEQEQSRPVEGRPLRAV